MSNLFSVPNLTNKASRSGFDLSKKNSFTAKIGELLPVMHRSMMPGDKAKLSIQHRTVTLPLETSAFTRFTEYFDFFFVPYDQLYRQAPQVLTQMQNNPTIAASSSSAVPIGQNLPWMRLSDFVTLNKNASSGAPYLMTLYNGGYVADTPTQQAKQVNYQGFNLGYEALKLYNYLGGAYVPETYFDSYTGKDTTSNPRIPSPRPYSLLPWAAYQKIYFDFYRFQQWENNSPQCYNFDYLPSTAFLSLTEMRKMDPQSNLFTLRHCNYPKDLFFGMLPSPQYGDTATVNVLYDPTDIKSDTFNVYSEPTTGMEIVTPQGDAESSLGEGDSSAIAIGINMLQLRQAKALQRYREVIGTGNQDYKSMIKKLYDVDVPEYTVHLVKYLGGFRSEITIDAVVNQNLADVNSKPNMTGVASAIDDQGKPIEFDCKEHGILMCIYRILPIIDYALCSPDFDLLKTEVDDFANPMFDRLGLQELPSLYLNDVNNNPSSYVADADQTIGYVPRYYDYKTSIDVVNGGFRTQLSHWLSALTPDFIDAWLPKKDGSFQINKDFFKVNAHLCDSIFFENVTQSVDTDPFLVNCNIDFKCVRNLDYRGLPTNN